MDDVDEAIFSRVVDGWLHRQFEKIANAERFFSAKAKSRLVAWSLALEEGVSVGIECDSNDM